MVNSMAFSDDLRQAISSSGQTVYAIAKGAGISPQVLGRFVNKERDIRLGTADKLAEYFRLGLAPLEKPPVKKRAKGGK